MTHIEPEIVESKPKLLVGFSVEMSYTDNQTGQLWGRFMPRRNEIVDPVSQSKYSLQLFGPDFNWYTANEHTRFTKWAGMEVSSRSSVPSGMSLLEVAGGSYAVFLHKGSAADFPITLQYILQTWLPSSDYVPDYSRPQYELLDERYKNNDPASEEEIWFPITKKTS